MVKIKDLVSDESNGWDSWLHSDDCEWMTVWFWKKRITLDFSIEEFKLFSEFVSKTQSELQKSTR